MTTPPDLDSLPDLQMAILTQIDSIPEITCEARHDVTHTHCTVEVRWSAPPDPCGCCPRMLACQGLHDHVFHPRWGIAGFCCGQCGREFSAAEARTGWYAV